MTHQPEPFDGEIEFPGEPLDQSLDEALGPATPEENAAFTAELQAIEEAERQAYIDSIGVILR